MPCFGDSYWRLSPQLLLLFLLFPVGGKAQCAKPTLPPGVALSDQSLSSDSFPDGSTAKLVCSVGYVRAGGSTSITCEGGLWSTPKLICEKKSCGSPGEIPHGKFNTSEGVDFGDTVYAVCNEGYELVGPAYRQCFDFGWNNRVPECEAVRCEGPPEIPNGRILNPPEAGITLYGDVIEYACNKGYTPSGPLQVSCSAEKTYMPSPPNCAAVSCPVPNIPNSYRKEGPPPPYKPKNYVIYACEMQKNCSTHKKYDYRYRYHYHYHYHYHHHYHRKGCSYRATTSNWTLTLHIRYWDTCLIDSLCSCVLPDEEEEAGTKAAPRRC
ncbi:hypothetical protein MATL_G00080900 [Megalops atlanticus]|uniref:Sushi domain-containing protein n=1 Tax=Megalops atlanticus TaxID=7932 RepID=A0A9D3T9Q7_MEGAT|nr:hypothetical protein MATL_G00080900 [Megalops atlanticus]